MDELNESLEIFDNWFNTLYEKRCQFVKLAHDNKFDRGIWRSTVDKYADPEHFIYELLQNAEDQNATYAKFELYTDRLVFIHNGKAFTSDDIESITGIGNSDKPSQPNKIGKFGIGFKSVFVITSRPCVYTCIDGTPFGFAIEELVIPARTEYKQYSESIGDTVFVLPFITDKSEMIYKKISQRLRSLKADTLLFLTSLNEIYWKTEIDSGIYLRASIQKTANIIKSTLIEESGPIDDKKIYHQIEYLVFSQYVNILEAAPSPEHKIQIAFRLEGEQIVPEPGHGYVNVYFLTEEKSKLKFRIHAPFLLTDNRANIKRDEQLNSYLIENAAELFINSLIDLRQLGMLNTPFLNVLPLVIEPNRTIFDLNSNRFLNDEFGMFLPFYNKIKNALKNLPLLPTQHGSARTHVNVSEGRMARGISIRNLLSESQLGQLYKTDAPLFWLDSDITQDRYPELHRFLLNIGVIEVDPAAFAERISTIFLEEQQDEWILSFYTFLLNQEALWDKGKQRAILRSKNIIRMENGTHRCPFIDGSNTPNAYLPPLNGEKSHFPCVKYSIATDENAHIFLQKLGLTLPDVVSEVVQYVLPIFKDKAISLKYITNIASYIQVIRMIANALRYCKQDKMSDFVELIIDTPFILIENTEYHTPKFAKIYDVLFNNEELLAWYDNNPLAWFPAKCLSNNEDFALILDSLFKHNFNIINRVFIKYKASELYPDNKNYVKIREFNSWHERGCDGFDPEAMIDGLEFALENISLERSLILWNCLLADSHLLRGTIERSTRKDYMHSEKKDEWSKLGIICSNALWIPDELGKYHRPCDISLTELHCDFENKSNEAIDLAKKLDMKNIHNIQNRTIIADKLHIPLDDVDDIIRIVQIFSTFDTNEKKTYIQELVNTRIKPDFPIFPTDNITRRIGRVETVTLNAPGKLYKKVQNTKRVSANETKEAARTYLRDLYTNTDDILVCQICEKSMPFKHKNAYYFEATECIGIPIVNKETQYNYLALCPNCAAMFRVANNTAQVELRDRIINASSEISLHIPVELANVSHTIRFVGKHLQDIQTVLKTLASL